MNTDFFTTKKHRKNQSKINKDFGLAESAKTSEKIIKFRNITKTFLNGKIIALNNISFSIKRNTIHTIIGENGSGKTTLMNVLSGLYKQDSGYVYINDNKVDIYGKKKIPINIGMVHQHFHLMEDYSVIQNIILGNEDTVSKFGFINKDKMYERFNQICKKYNIDLDPKIKIRKLSVGKRQLVEILKILWVEKDVLVFDEPTATLSVNEIKHLLNTIRSLKNDGKTILFISHKIQEVLEISDYITVLRRGVVTSKLKNENITKDDIIEHMVGENIKLIFPERKQKDEIDIQIKNLHYKTSKGFDALRDVNFDIKKGEIFGIGGIEGNGQEEFINLLTGMKKSSSGEIIYKDKNILNQDIRTRNKYMSHIPIDRQKYGLVSIKDLKFNSILSIYDTPKLSLYSVVNPFKKKSEYQKVDFDSVTDLDEFKHIKNENESTKDEFNNKIDFINKKRREKYYKINNARTVILNKSIVDDYATEIVNNFNVEGATLLTNPIRNLSGGNQQKFVVGREIIKNHSLLIAGHPTRGLDIKAIKMIYTNLIENANKGRTTILYSLEISELLAVCDRVAIFYKGKIVDIINPRKVDMTKVSQLMVGDKHE